MSPTLLTCLNNSVNDPGEARLQLSSQEPRLYEFRYWSYSVFGSHGWSVVKEALLSTYVLPLISAGMIRMDVFLLRGLDQVFSPLITRCIPYYWLLGWANSTLMAWGRLWSRRRTELSPKVDPGCL